MGPAWRDPHFISEQKLRQFETHEQTIRDRERDRERRRMQPLMAVDRERFSDDFEGCTE
jgi:hypothetical protein